MLNHQMINDKPSYVVINYKQLQYLIYFTSLGRRTAVRGASGSRVDDAAVTMKFCDSDHPFFFSYIEVAGHC